MWGLHAKVATFWIKNAILFGRERNELLTLSAYVGTLVAVRRQYNSIVPALFKHTK